MHRVSVQLDEYVYEDIVKPYPNKNQSFIQITYSNYPSKAFVKQRIIEQLSQNTQSDIGNLKAKGYHLFECLLGKPNKN